MMRRLQFILLTMFAVWLQSQAQIRYEYWLDGNRSSIQRGNLILGEQTIAVDVAGMPYPGLHFLNILPYDESGEPGVWQSIAFLMPECWPGTNDATQVEYWVTGYDKQPRRQSYSGTAVTLDIDAANYSPGLHFLNYRTLNARGEGGSWNVIGFLMPEDWPAESEATMMEYWVTGYDSQPRRLPYSGTAVTLDIDAANYSPGLHFLNYRTLNARGEGGSWNVIGFLMPEDWPAESEATMMEYWVTGYDRQPHRLPYEGGEVTFDIDISQMSYGLHFLNYRTQNERGEFGAWKVIRFYVNNGIFDAEPVEGEFWIDDNEVQTITAVMPGTVTLQMDLNDVEPGEHTFNFRGKNSFGSYGENYSEKFMFFVLGDVNGDGDVDIADAVCIVNYVVGKPNTTFNEAAADVNGDGDIDIADAVKIVNLVVGKIDALARPAKDVKDEKEPQ